MSAPRENFSSSSWPSRPPPTTIAIIGTGLAGLATAYALARDERFAVEVFEARDSPGLDAASVTLKDTADDSLHRVDLPMRSFAGGYYERLLQLYRHLGVRYAEQRFFFAFENAPGATPGRDAGFRDAAEEGKMHDGNTATDDDDGGGGGGKTYFCHHSGLSALPPRPATTSLLAHAAHCVCLLLCYFWFTVCVFCVAPRHDEDLAAYLRRIRLPGAFCRGYLLPLMSAVATCSHAALLAAPAADVVGYKRLTHRRPHYSVVGGVHEAEDRLVACCEGTGRVRFLFGRNVFSAEPVGDGGGRGVEVRWNEREDHGPVAVVVHKSKRFDKVVFATPPDVVGSLYARLRTDMMHIPTARVVTAVARPRLPSSPVTHYKHPANRSLPPRRGEEARLILTTNSNAATLQKLGIHADGRANQVESITLRTDFASGKTEAAHQVSCGAVVITNPLSPREDHDDDDYSKEKHRTTDAGAGASAGAGKATIIHRTSFTRVLRTVSSRRTVNWIFSTRGKQQQQQQQQQRQRRRRRRRWQRQCQEPRLLGHDEEGSEEHGLGRVAWRNGDDGIYLVGGWCWDGMVLLEGCVVSAARVAEEMGATVPWHAS